MLVAMAGSSDTHADPTAAYAREVADVREDEPLLAEQITEYAELARGQTADDAEERLLRIRAHDGDQEQVGRSTSLVELLGFELDEPRHSLALAALLDPARSGLVPRALWPRLLDALTREAVPPLQPAQRSAWHPLDESLSRVVVTPTRYGSEYRGFDVWARVQKSKETGLQAALLIELKLLASEQDEQLRRYFEIVENEEPGAADRTTFVFLTPTGRAPRSAQGWRERWHCLSWVSMVRVLAAAARSGFLPPASRVLLHQYRRLAERDALGRSAALDARRRLRRLWPDASGEAGRKTPEEALVREHKTICELDADIGGL
jgi:hypothetical protein